MRTNNVILMDDILLDDAESVFVHKDNAKVSGAALAGRWVPSGLAAFWLGVDAARARVM
jgi:hypothetical protein